jgi:hypothetical protein
MRNAENDDIVSAVSSNYAAILDYGGARGSVVGWGATPQAGRSHYGPGVDSASNRNEYRELIK